MPLLKLSGIGKIYYSEGNVAVGIRGIDLSFERGEFVAVTGASGSGKSTLLNVISGMDSYEEGELYIEDSPTSHYLEPDWEEYRSKYISFIFQDYNILESYTVLQNVELALMHIKDKRERRKRAIELLTRVGMEKHLRQKGSKLSGGQKQRTVIARALAKDSPIILADEPTGNLDEATSKEIIELLREVSKDKLLIVVTHNYEEVEAHATRHIRIFDGAVEFDRGEKPAGEAKREPDTMNFAPTKKKKLNLRAFRRDLGNGLSLGAQVFASRPKLAVFTCLLMTVGMLGVFLLTSLCFTSEILEMTQYNMFEYTEGRVVLVRRDGKIPMRDEIDELVKKYSAERAIYCDYLCDNTTTVRKHPGNGYYYYYDSTENPHVFALPVSECGINFEGSLPDAPGEVLLNLPISSKPKYEDMILGQSSVYLGGLEFTLCGINYYYDNNIPPNAYLTESDYKTICAVTYFNHTAPGLEITIIGDKGSDVRIYAQYDIATLPELGNKVWVNNYLDIGNINELNISYQNKLGLDMNIPSDRIKTSLPADSGEYGGYEFVFGTDIYTEIANKYTSDNYKQFSLFFKNDREAKRAAESLRNGGYIAVMSNATYEPDPLEAFGFGFLFFMIVAVWLGGVLCLAFFIRICQSRSIVSFKNDIAIMRSMGIKTTVIKISMYMRSVIALIPALLAMAGVAAFIYTTPSLNGLFAYLYTWQYALIFLGLLIIALHVSYKQQSKLFAGSVKKTLSGGELND